MYVLNVAGLVTEALAEVVQCELVLGLGDNVALDGNMLAEEAGWQARTGWSAPCRQPSRGRCAMRARGGKPRARPRCSCRRPWFWQVRCGAGGLWACEGVTAVVMRARREPRVGKRNRKPKPKPTRASPPLDLPPPGPCAPPRHQPRPPSSPKQCPLRKFQIYSIH